MRVPETHSTSVLLESSFILLYSSRAKKLLWLWGVSFFYQRVERLTLVD